MQFADDQGYNTWMILTFTNGDAMMRFESFLIVAAFVLSATLTANAEVRKWTSSDGKYVIEAELVEADDDVVTLKKADGKTVKVPVEKLSEADQKFLAELDKPAAKDPAPATEGDDKDVKAALLAKGLRVTSAGLAVVEEADLSKGLKEVSKLRKTMQGAEKELAAMKKQQENNKKAITGLTALNVQLNARLANVGPNDVTTNNKLVGAINANISQMKLLNSQSDEIETLIKTSHGKANEARESYIQFILDLRKTTDAISEKYKSLASDQEAKTALQQLEQDSGKAYELAESRAFLSSLKKLKSLEDTVLSESIELRKEGGTFYVSVVVDGKHTQEMVVDSGASLITLPQKVATACGIEVKSSDPEIILQIADGSKIKGHLVTIPSVRVGKFTVENVECAVLGPEAVDATALLGMSFLGNFKFELHAQDSKLTMVKVETEESSR